MKKIIIQFLSDYRGWKTPGNIEYGTKRYFYKFCANDELNLLGSEISAETNNSKISGFDGDKRFLALFFLVSSKLTNLKEEFIRVHKVVWQILWKLLGRYFRTQLLFPVIKLAYLFSFYRVWQISFF